MKGEEKQKRNDAFDIIEPQLLLKTYFAIRQKIQCNSPRKLGLVLNTASNNFQEAALIKQVSTP
jgi:hypothetical protein